MRRLFLVGLMMACEPAGVSEDLDGDGILGRVDCDDADASVGAPSAEVCNGIDDDCDGLIDEEAAGTDVVSPDADGDGFGEAGRFIVACGIPEGFAPTGTDCDDGDPSVFPGAIEQCNDIDDDCDGAIDNDAEDALEWFADLDRDGFGGDERRVSCEQPDQEFILTHGDCNDSDFTVNPSAREFCNQIDDDCDGVVDNGCR